jgi:hypothetical protein
MKLFDKFFKKKTKQPEQPKEAKAPKKTEKELATERGEPYVAILGLEIDADNMHQGAFDLDWNEKFVANLLRAGYAGKTDADIVDQWFQNVCRHVVMETWEQEQAIIKGVGQYVNTRDIGGGRTEVS